MIYLNLHKSYLFILRLR